MYRPIVATEVIAEKAVEFPKAGRAKREAIKTDNQTAFIGDYMTNCVSTRKILTRHV